MDVTVLNRLLCNRLNKADIIDTVVLINVARHFIRLKQIPFYNLGLVAKTITITNNLFRHMVQ